MTAFIIYKCGNKHIPEMCLQCTDLTQLNIFIPHIGETFIDMQRNVEYEVEDVVRSYRSNDEYGVQVMLKRREKNRYERKY